MNYANLEVQDDGPDQAQGELRVAVDDVLGPDVDQPDLFAVKKVEGRIHVVEHVETHDTPLAWLRKRKHRSRGIICQGYFTWTESRPARVNMP